MRMRKLFAGVVAAATMLGGLALGASTANAAETITLNPGATGVVAGHTYKVVELAKYVTPDTQEIQTVAGAHDAIVTAIAAATKSDSNPDGLQVPTGVDPLVWAQSGDLNGTGAPLFGDSSAFPWNGNAASRAFADALVEYAKANGTDVTADTEPYEISVAEGGLYLIVDTTEAAEGVTQKSLPIIVGTANTAFNYKGEIDVKNQDKDIPPTKTVTGDTDKTVSVGDTLSYTIEGTVPSTTGQSADYTYVFNDYASAGLSIDTHKTNVKVYVEGSEQPLADTEYTVTPADQTVTGDGTNVTFSVTLTKAALDKLQDKAGKKLSVKYDATVTDDAKINTVTNAAEVVNGGNSSGQGTPVELYSNKFDFTKVFADKSEVKNAQFTLYDAEGENAIQRDGQDYVVTSGANGLVAFDGLKNGTYTIKETKVADGAQNVTGTFKVTLTYNETTKTTDVLFSDTALSDPYDLVKFTDNNTKATVTNVKSITQLPLTGAAGTALFTVIGLLLAGAAATVALKSRETKRALRA